MAQKTAGAKDGAMGDNSDPAARAQMMRDALDGLDQCEVDLSEAREKIKKRRDKYAGMLKSLGHKMGDMAFPRRMRALKRAIDDADNPKDRGAAQARFDMAIATVVEGFAAVDEEQQLDFNQILDRGEKARASLAGDGKTTIMGGKEKADKAKH